MKSLLNLAIAAGFVLSVLEFIPSRSLSPMSFLTAEGGQRRHRRLRRQSLHRLAKRDCQSFALCAV